VSASEVRASLQAVSSALDHFARSLEAAGFDDGADTYSRMADVVLGQRAWAESEGVGNLKDEFRQIGALATRVRSSLEPYVDSMSRLASLSSVESWEGVEPDSTEERVLATLSRIGRPLSATAIGSAVDEPTSRVRAVLEELERSGLIKRASRGGRALFTIGGSV
jgi:hypothetical protein